MSEKRTLTIKKNDGTLEEVEELISFEFEDNKKKYIVYTKNEVDEYDNMTIYVTEIVKEGENFKFLGVESESEWNKIKAALRALIQKDDE